MEILILYLNEAHQETVEIKLPEMDLMLSFQDNVTIRKSYIDHMITLLKIKYQRAIAVRKKHEIYLVLQSKMNDQDFREELKT